MTCHSVQSCRWKMQKIMAIVTLQKKNMSNYFSHKINRSTHLLETVQWTSWKSFTQCIWRDDFYHLSMLNETNSTRSLNVEHFTEHILTKNTLYTNVFLEENRKSMHLYTSRTHYIKQRAASTHTIFLSIMVLGVGRVAHKNYNMAWKKYI